jgi:hypothetical protein
MSIQLRPLPLALALALLTALAQANGPTRSGPEQATRLWSPEVRSRAASLVALGPVADLPARLADVAADPTLDPVGRDAVLYAYLQLLRRQPPPRQSDAALAWLSAYPAQATVLHAESASATVPLFDVAASAQGLANEKRHRLDLDAFATRGPEAVLRSHRKDGAGPGHDTIAAALAAAPVGQHAAWRAAIAGRPDLADGAPGLLLALAERDIDTLADGLQQADPALATDVLKRAASTLDAVATVRLCGAMAAHPDPGVRALAIALGSRAASASVALLPAWQGGLRAALADPEAGAAAALHLARLLDAAGLAALKAWVGSDPALQRRMILIERLRADPALMQEVSGS